MKKFRLLLMLMCALLGFSQASAATESWGYLIQDKAMGTSSGFANWNGTEKIFSLANNTVSSTSEVGTNGTVDWTGTFNCKSSASTSNNGSGTQPGGKYSVAVGSKSNPCNKWTMSTLAFSGKKINKITVYFRAGASTGTFNLKWTVGTESGYALDSDNNKVSIGSSNADGVVCNVGGVVATSLSFEIENTVQNVASNASSGIVFAGMAVEYEDGGSVTPSEPVDPKLSITNAERDETGHYYSKLVAINDTFTPEFSPAGLTITASGNDESIAKYENGVIKPVADGITTFTFTSAPVENTYLQGETKLELRVYTPTPVDPQLGVKNTLTDGKLVLMKGQNRTLAFTPDDVKVNAPTGNDDTIAVYEDGNIVAKGVGTTTFHFTSDAVEYKYTAGEFDLTVEVTPPPTFDFVNEDYGLTRVSSTTSSSAANEGYVVENTTITSNNIIIKFTGTKGFRLWETSSDAYLRAYSGGGFVITAPEGYIFDRMTFTGTGNWEVGTENQGTYSNMVWTAGENELSEVKFSYTGKSSGNWKTLDVVLKPAAAAVPAIVVSYQGDPMGENDHFTLVKDSELEVLVENAEAAKVTYYILDENVQGATAESGVVENNKFVLDKVGKFRIDFIASDAANTVLASKTVYVIVKGSDTEITSTTYTLDFVNNTYGMMLNPATGSQVGENNNFTGTNTNGLVFFIPKGTNPVSLGNANDGQELKMEQGGEFRVNINNYGQKIAKVEITGSNLDVLTITSNYDAAAEGVMTDGKLVYTPGTDVIARDFVVKYPATRAAGGPVYIKGINVTTAVDTAVEAIDAETAEPVYYDLQGNRVVNPERGIYIKVVDTKATKVLL